MTGGRPTRCTPELLDKARHYLENYEDYGDVFPSQIGLQVVLKISDGAIDCWKHPEFAAILGNIRRKQHRVLINTINAERERARAAAVCYRRGCCERLIDGYMSGDWIDGE